MNTNEKCAVILLESDAPHTKMKVLKQNHNNPNTPNFQPQRFSDTELERMRRREMLESTRLSRLPSLPKRRSFEMPKFEPTRKVKDEPKPAAVCVGCGANLDTDEPLQITFSGCRKCLAIYGRLDAAFDENSKRKKKEMLEKMIRGAK